MLAGQPEMEKNPVYHDVLKAGLKVGDVTAVLPLPLLGDQETADAERAALRKIAGSDRAVEDLTRDSVTAPLILKTHDTPASGRGVIRGADLWFVVRARLDDIEPEKAAGGKPEGETVEAANMKFTVKTLGKEELAPRGQDDGGTPASGTCT